MVSASDVIGGVVCRSGGVGRGDMCEYCDDGVRASLRCMSSA